MASRTTTVIALRAASVTVALTALAVGAQGAVGAGWSVQHVPSTPRGTLVGVSCTSPKACIAVGSYSGRASRALTERWTGSRWVIEPARLPAGAVDGGFNDVSCTSGRRCTAVGAYDLRDGRTDTLAERWTGSRWSVQRTQNQPGVVGSLLNSVSCTSPSACTAVGEYGLPHNGPPFALIERWNGSRWSLQPTLDGGGFRGFLTGVSCPASKLCTAVGGDTRGHMRIERWHGAGWTRQRTPMGSAFLSSVSCVSANACTAVGTGGAGAAAAPLAEGWNGVRWSSENARVDGDDFTSVSCTSARACTVVGDAGGGSQTLAAGWNGSRWSVQPTPATPGTQTNYTLFDVSCVLPSVCVAVGGINKAANGRAAGALIERRS